MESCWMPTRCARPQVFPAGRIRAARVTKRIRLVSKRIWCGALLLAALDLVRLFAAPVPGARPNFEGLWNSSTATPLERPAQLKDKAFFTPDEAAEWERQFVDRN